MSTFDWAMSTVALIGYGIALTRVAKVVAFSATRLALARPSCAPAGPPGSSARRSPTTGPG